MAYDAIAVGPQDLSAGINYLLSRSPSNFPWISANILNENGTPLFKPYIIKKVGNISVGIIGITGEIALQENLKLENWQDILPPIINELSKKTEFILLLSTLRNEENEQIAKSFDQVRVIITGYPRQRNQAPKTVNNALLTQTTRQGKYIGFLTCSPGNSGSWGENPQNRLKKLEEKEGALKIRVERLKHNTTMEAVTKKEAINKVKQQLTTIQATLTTVRDEIAVQEREKKVHGTFQFSFQAMTKNSPEDRDINELVNNSKKSIKEFNLQRSQNNRVSPDTPELLIENMEGHSSCMECHEAQTLFWQATQHSRAYDTLLKKGQAYNLECLPCHVTYNTKSMASHPENTHQLLSLPDSLLSVGCEHCHGPAKKHARNPEESSPIRTPKIESCLICHTEERDHNFDYEKKLKKIQCPRE